MPKKVSHQTLRRPMRILLDHNVPVPLIFSLNDHSVETAFERGWNELKNGELISAAEPAAFDLLITADKKHSVSANLSRRWISILLLTTNDWASIRLVKDELVSVPLARPKRARVR